MYIIIQFKGDIMKNLVFKIEKKFFSILILLITFSSVASYADTIEIRNGVKTTFADKPISLVDTIDKSYSFKWALDRKGNWKLYIRRLNGRLIGLSNVWVNLDRTIHDPDGSNRYVIDYYYFDMNGNLVTGWYVDVNKNYYYLQTDEKELGRMARGWQKIGDEYYYFNLNGILLRDTITPDGFHVDAYGRWK